MRRFFCKGRICLIAIWLKLFLIKPITRRRIGWEEWYGEKWWNKLLTLPVRFFWYISDYGYSTFRVLLWFLLFITVFASVYTVYPEMLEIKGEPLITIPVHFLSFSLERANFWQMLAFSMSTMVTLDFSNINVSVAEGIPHTAGMIIVSLNLMVGYFMLAVLVTRLVIFFQTLGPGSVPKKKTGQRRRIKT